MLTNDTDASPTVTAIQPFNFHPDNVRQLVKKEFGLVLAGGQQQLKGKIFRIGHMAYCTPADILQTISCIELGLAKLGVLYNVGIGVNAAQLAYLRGGSP